jgi:hypothetical protein
VLGGEFGKKLNMSTQISDAAGSGVVVGIAVIAVALGTPTA